MDCHDVETDSFPSINTHGDTSGVGRLNNEGLDNSHLQRPISRSQNDNLQEQLAPSLRSSAASYQSGSADYLDSSTARSHGNEQSFQGLRMADPGIPRHYPGTNVASREQRMNVTGPPEKIPASYERVRKKLIKENGVNAEVITAMLNKYGWQCLASRSVFFAFADRSGSQAIEKQESLSSSSETESMYSTQSSGDFATAIDIPPGQGRGTKSAYYMPQAACSQVPFALSSQAACSQVPFALSFQRYVGAGRVNADTGRERNDTGGVMTREPGAPNAMRSPQPGIPRQFDPMVCKICAKNCINVTQLPCGHLICSECVTYNETGYYNCQICGAHVEQINAYDRSQFQKKA